MCKFLLLRVSVRRNVREESVQVGFTGDLGGTVRVGRFSRRGLSGRELPVGNCPCGGIVRGGIYIEPSSMNCGTFLIAVELPRRRKMKENKPIMNKIPSVNNVSPALKVSTSNSNNPTLQSSYKITHQTQNSIIMNPSRFSYNPTNVG